MEGEKLMIGIARWANHSCEPNCDYYMGGGYHGRECIRLRALRPIVDGEELVTFYNSNFFGDNNADCLCGMTQLHGNQNVSSDETIKDTVREIAKKRCRKSKPRISLEPIVTPKLHLEEMIKFYEDCSNSSELSLEFEAPLDVQDEEKLDEIAANVPPVDSGANQLVEDEIESDSFEGLANFNEFVDQSGSFLSDTDIAESSGLGFNEVFSRMRLREVNEVSAGNLIASLLAIAARHNCSDALLFGLIKRDQELFDHQTITPLAVKTKFSEFSSLYQDEKITLENGELIVVKFRQLLVDIVEEHIDEMLFYAANKTFNEDLHMPEFRIIGNKLTVRLIVNKNGANVSKSPVTSAWPLFISVADLPPKKRQGFKILFLRLCLLDLAILISTRCSNT